jgi:hypothetical protein
MSAKKSVRILHFNDVYDIEEKKSSISPSDDIKTPLASAARFVTAMRERGNQNK